MSTPCDLLWKTPLSLDQVLAVLKEPRDCLLIHIMTGLTHVAGPHLLPSTLGLRSGSTCLTNRLSYPAPYLFLSEFLTIFP